MPPTLARLNRKRLSTVAHYSCTALALRPTGRRAENADVHCALFNCIDALREQMV